MSDTETAFLPPFSEKNCSENKIQYCFHDIATNRKELFKEALLCAQNGKVLYILHEEFHELPQLSQDMVTVNRHYMKMITFLYAKNLVTLIESVASLPDWKNVPSTIIVENLNEYCPKEKMQNACGVVALLIDTAHRCFEILKLPCKLLISVNKEVGDEYCLLLKELYHTLL